MTPSLQSPHAPDLALDLALAQRIANLADEITMRRFLAVDLQVETKPDDTPVTEADREVERAAARFLTEESPGDALLGEEYGLRLPEQAGLDADPGSSASVGSDQDGLDRALSRGRCWVIDPIDGTKNFLRGVPVWATLIALVVDGEPVVGVASAPAMARRWWGCAGAGAFTRDPDDQVRPIRTSRVADLADASLSYSDREGWDVDAFERLTTGVWRTRAFGDFWSHLLVAEGAVDLAAEPELNAWDVAALVPIVREAGGTITAFDGSDALRAALDGRGALTSNGALHEAARALLA